MIWISNLLAIIVVTGDAYDLKATTSRQITEIAAVQSVSSMGFHTIHVVPQYDASASVWWPPMLSAASALADMHIPKRHVHPPGKCLKGAIQHKHTLNWTSLNLHPPYDPALPTGFPAFPCCTPAAQLLPIYEFTSSVSRYHTFRVFPTPTHCFWISHTHIWQRPSRLDCS